MCLIEHKLFYIYLLHSYQYLADNPFTHTVRDGAKIYLSIVTL